MSLSIEIPIPLIRDTRRTVIAYSIILSLTAFAVVLILLFIALTNPLFLINYVILIIVNLTGTTIFHFALSKPVARYRGSEAETVQEHFLYFFLAYIIYAIIDLVISFNCHYFINWSSFGDLYLFSILMFNFWMLKGANYLLGITIIGLYSTYYPKISGRNDLYMDIAGFVLALTVIALLEFLFGSFLY